MSEQETAITSCDRHAHCGCCGGCRPSDGDWCKTCRKHLAPRAQDGRYLPPWDRTYFAQHNQPCPNRAWDDDAVIPDENGRSEP